MNNKTFDINNYKNLNKQDTRYDQQLARMFSQGLATASIQSTVTEAIKNIDSGKKSFVIYGEPQSGKTEMMIALTARLLDKGYKIVIVLLNDNIQLLQQNLVRFRKSNINPTPVDVSEILEESINDKAWIIFCKKNTHDLKKLNEKLYTKSENIVIDDEADFASPNAKINRAERTAINHAINKLLAKKGIYIGITATPARLDMNNTFDNLTEDWICFNPHKEYVGKDVFFPLDFNKPKFSPNFLPQNGDNPTYLKEAILNFLVNVAYINRFDNIVKNQLQTKGQGNACFSFLIHTSGKTADHKIDKEIASGLFDILSDNAHKLFPKYVEIVYKIATQKYGQSNADDIVKFILLNIGRKHISVLDTEGKSKISLDLTNPIALFTIIIGGNIVSRGVTFNNLLGMFFTRDVKHKMQQDTYIQRARMFGSRGQYYKYFELWIPEQLYLDWHKCFVYHQLSLEAVKADKKAPIWISDNRVQPVSASSIDKSSVVTDAGEMYFAKFTWNEEINKLIENNNINDLEKIQKINEIYGDKVLPSYLIKFMLTNKYTGCIAIHKPRPVGKETEYHDTLVRSKGIFGGKDTQNKFSNAIHDFLIVYNTANEARIIYKYSENVQFLKNLKGKSYLNV
jgi:hypothetical protein